MPFLFRPRNDKVRFDAAAKAINAFKTHVQGIACPACTQKTLKVDKLEVSKLWTADISCTNCDFKGAVNTSGFSFIGVSSKGKAVKAEKKDATIPDRTLRR